MTTEQIIILVSTSSIVLLLAIIFVFFSKWKVAFSGTDGENAFEIIPSGVVDSNTRSFKKLKKEYRRFAKHQSNVATSIIEKNLDIANQLISSDQAIRADQERTKQALQAVLTTIRDLSDETKILREEIQSQAQELNRHRKGYDVDILSTALIPIARMHRELQSDLENSSLPDETRNTLIVLEDEYLGTLETKGVRLVYPEVGERYRDQKNIQHPPLRVSASEKESVGKIAKIIQPAYELETSVRNVVILPAIVEVYSGEGLDADNQPNITDNQNEESNHG